MHTVRVVPASSVRGCSRLPRVADSDQLVPLEWNYVSRTDDDLTLTFTVNRSRQRVDKIAGVSIRETADSVSVAILGIVSSRPGDRVTSSLTAQCLVDLPTPLRGRRVVNPAQP